MLNIHMQVSSGRRSCHSKRTRKTTISTQRENVTWVLKVRELSRVFVVCLEVLNKDLTGLRILINMVM